ncbi:MAG: HAMP domain-containing protein, partial [Anaerolineae bacterium]|nr:HAMP domain-containing protein [Anaerolineae bacterium]
MRSLWMRLTSAFILIVLLYGAVNTYLINRATKEQFSLYTSQTGLTWAENLAPSLEQYYLENGSWQGVESFFQSPVGGMSSLMVAEMMQRMSSDMMEMETTNIWDMMGFQLVLVDSNGWVQTDTSSHLIETKLNESDLASGVSLMLDNTQIGTLLALDTSLSSDSASNDFVRTLNATSWQASLVAAFFALIFGSLLFRQIIAPIHAVTDAARKITSGNLGQRIPESGGDEVGQMAQTFNQMADSLEHN